MDALNIAYGVKESRPFWKVRGIALLATLGSAAIAHRRGAGRRWPRPAIADRLGEPLGTVVTWLRLPVAGLLMMFVWAGLYYLLPDAQQKFKFITLGSVVGVFIWVLASCGFSKYVANFGSYDANYGALGGVIVMLMWMWISAQVILLGAEINAILEHKSPDGKSPGSTSWAARARRRARPRWSSAGGALPGNTTFRPERHPLTGKPGRPPQQPRRGGGHLGRRLRAGDADARAGGSRA